MIAYSVWTIYQKDKDISFIKKVYPQLYLGQCNRLSRSDAVFHLQKCQELSKWLLVSY